MICNSQVFRILLVRSCFALVDLSISEIVKKWTSNIRTESLAIRF